MDIVKSLVERLEANIGRVILGKAEPIRMALIALLCEGHLLIEDVPGVGKTMLSRALARSLGCTHGRIQFTPDLLPSDILGVTVYNQHTQEFSFREGPIHHQVVLADEINRATPKTQSALLECMDERQISVEGQSRKLPQPFLVLATQNPVEFEGTYPLPEAQLDRFLMRIQMGYPVAEAEEQMLANQQASHPIDSLEQVVEVADLVAAQQAVRKVHLSAGVRRYIVALVTATRESPQLFLGASPRGSLALGRAAQAMAALRGRDFVSPDDVQQVAVATLAHRLIPKASSSQPGATAKILAALLEQVPVPDQEG